MRTYAYVGAAAFLVMSIGTVAAVPLAPRPAAGAADLSVVVQVQEKKSDTVTQRVKRAWKDLTGYKFDVGCPMLFPVNHRTCTETGKDRSEARAKCAAQNRFCLISDAR
jgi:hypothetical protein